VFEKTKALGVHNALDTAANINWTVLEDVLPSVDVVLLDLKVIDPVIHKKFTAVSNNRILQNADHLAQQAIDLIVRIPVIHGVNATEDHMNQAALFLKSFPRLQTEKRSRIFWSEYRSSSNRGKYCRLCKGNYSN
jgi:pyruvate formate lyase activating enzyme